MREANAMDGAAGVTQAGIKDGASMVYDFVIDEAQHGTFWYHAHDGVQRADGLYGGLVIHEPALGSEDPASVADETLLLIGDWYHRSAAEALEFYMHPGAFGLETIPDSILLNGENAFKCADAVPARPVDCVQRQNVRPVFHFDRRRRNVLRVVNVGAYAGFFLGLQTSMLTPLTVDGGFSIIGQAAKCIGSLHPGQRMDLLLEPTNRAGDPDESLSITLDDAFFKYQNDALTMKHQFQLSWTGDSNEISGEGTDALQTLDIQGVKSLHTQSEAAASSADRTIVLYAVTQRLAHLDNEPHGFINNTMWPSSPSNSALISEPPASWSANHFIPNIPYNVSSPLWIDIVLNNRDEEGHPFHLHGYSFWILSTYSSDYNWGSYNPFEDDPPGGEYDLVNAVMRDTVYVPRRGYAVLRLRADNPGLWMFHCHVLWHMGSGMAMALDVS
jgi:FtsP/CotA-like multicopper oxidase with cupredoxin domain